MLIYISGGITGVEGFRQQFNEAEEYLTSQGHKVINPARMLDLLPATMTHEDHLKLGLYLLGRCEAIYMLPGWELSSGACQENLYAEGKEMEVMGEKRAEPDVDNAGLGDETQEGKQHG